MMTTPYHGPYIAGDFQHCSDSVPLHAPYDNTQIATIGYASHAQMLKALSFATAHLNTIAALTTADIKQGLTRFKKALQDNQEELAQCISQEAAKPINLARIEVQRALTVIDDGIQHADFCDQQEAVELGAASTTHSAFSKAFPIGVIVGITPFNFPLNLLLHKLIPSIISKNAIIIKPAVQTPLTAMKVAELFDNCGLAKALFQVCPCSNEVAQSLIEDKRVHCLSFTGSTAVGKQLQALIPHKKVLLECGGTATAIVDDSADISDTSKRIVQGAFAYSGQSCISVQHVYVHHAIYYSFKEQLLSQLADIKAVAPNEEGLLSCLISKQAQDRFNGLIDDAYTNGATKTNFSEAVLLEQLPAHAKLMQDEAFGPVLCLHSFASCHRVIQKLNDSHFGLQHALFSSCEDTITLAYNSIDVGGLLINESPTWRIDSMPYGGVKESGNCKEGVVYSAREFTNSKLCVRRHS